jgi:hypothetical protein
MEIIVQAFIFELDDVGASVVDVSKRSSNEPLLTIQCTLFIVQSTLFIKFVLN